MISSNKRKMQTFGLAADGKPANVSNGHKHTEIDTGKVYRYSDGDGTWYEQPSSGGGGSSLPAVTSEDNGDVLTVVDGAWAKAAPSGGGGQFIITVTPNGEETELSVDKTYQEIASAFAEGKTFYFYYPQYVRPFAAYSVGVDDGTYYIEGVYIDIEAVAEDMADIAVRKIYVTAGSDNGVTAFSELSIASGTYSSIPPWNL